MKTSFYSFCLMIFFFVISKQELRAQYWLTAGNTLTGTEKLGSLNNADLRIFTNNQRRMTIKAGGNVGIGLINPQSKLDVLGNISINNFTIRLRNGNNGDHGLRYDTLTDGPYLFGFNGGALGTINLPHSLIWDYNGNVSVRSELMVDNAGINPGSTVNTLKFGGGGTGEAIGSKRTSGDNQYGLDFYTASTNRMSITNGGNVGIGIGNRKANYRLEVVPTDAFGTQFWDNNNQFALSIQGNTIVANGNTGDQNIEYYSKGNSGSHVFYTNSTIAISPNERMRITGTGNVGIGINAPFRKLQLQNGDIRIEDSLASQRFFEFVNRNSNRYDYRFEHWTGGGGLLWIEGSNNNLSSSTDLAVFNTGPKYGDTTSWGKYVFTIFGSALATGGTWVNSDAKLKHDIISMNNALDIIKHLKPQTYLFKKEGYENLNLPSQKQYGFIAQELEKILPELVNTSKEAVNVDAKGVRKMEDIKSVNYTELIPILTKAIQEQQLQIEKQQNQIEELKQLVKNLSQNISSSAVSDDASAKTAVSLTNSKLDQNIPNPLTNTASISYTVPANAKNVQLLITSNTGKMVKQFALTTGKGVVNIDASSLSSGSYNYSLVVDGKIIESKKMVVAR